VVKSFKIFNHVIYLTNYEDSVYKIHEVIGNLPDQQGLES